MSFRDPSDLIDRHEAFLARRPVDRPLVGLWRGGYFPAEQFPSGTARWREGQLLSPEDVRLEAFRADYDHLYRHHREVDDDFFYIASAYWGIPWLEAILGCPIVADKTTCWAEACQGGPDDVLSLDPKLEGNPWMKCLARFTAALVEFAGDRFPVCAPLLRGPGDAAAAMRGGMPLVLECVDRPDTARLLMEHCASVRMAVLRRLRAIIPPWRGTHAAGGYPSRLWARRTVAYNQDDFAALLSPDLFRELLLPLERQMCKEAEVNFIHLHSGCLYPADILLEDDRYDVIEVNIDHAGAGPDLAGLLPTFQKIQAAGRPLMLWGEIRLEEWRLLREKLSPVGLSVQPIISRLEEAVAFLR